MFSFHNTNLNLSNQVRRSLSFSLHNSTTVEAACKFESMSYWSRMLELSMVFVKWRGFLYVVNSCCLKCNQLQDFFLLIFQTSLNIDVYVWAPGFSPKKWRFKNIFSIKIIISKFQFSNKNIQTQKKKSCKYTHSSTHSQTKESRHRPRHPRPRNANARRPDRSNDPSRWHRLRHSRPPIGPEVYIQSLAPRVPRKFPPPPHAAPQFVLPLALSFFLSFYSTLSLSLSLFLPQLYPSIFPIFILQKVWIIWFYL